MDIIGAIKKIEQEKRDNNIYPILATIRDIRKETNLSNREIKASINYGVNRGILIKGRTINDYMQKQ